MKLQELMENSELGITLSQVKAFFLGIMTADRPMSFEKAMDELFQEAPEEKVSLGGELKKYWEELNSKRKAELEKLISEANDLDDCKDRLDYFLTGLSLSGTTSESVKSEELADLIDELEDMVEDLEDYLSEDGASAEVGNEMKEFLLDTWADFVKTKQ